MEYVQPQNFQSMIRYYYQHTKQSNEFLSIYTHQDLLYMPQPIF